MIVKALVLLLLVAATVATAAVIVMVTTAGSDETSRLADSNRTPAATRPPALPRATTIPTQAPATAAPLAASLPDRKSCAEIKGTPYRSDGERAFYLTKCAAQTQSQGASPPNISVNTSAACGTDIQIKTSRSDKTFNVSGTTVEQIDASLQANGPAAEGQTAAGLTEYSYGINGSFCNRAGSCSIGAMSVTADIIVTLPNLTTLSHVSPDVKAIWDRFAELVKVHENRHVTILEEGLAEMQRQMLLVAEQPNCDSLDHEIDKVWLLFSSNMENRQRAFHAADSAGQGGSVVR